MEVRNGTPPAQTQRLLTTIAPPPRPSPPPAPQACSPTRLAASSASCPTTTRWGPQSGALGRSQAWRGLKLARCLLKGSRASEAGRANRHSQSALRLGWKNTVLEPSPLPPPAAGHAGQQLLHDQVGLPPGATGLHPRGVAVAQGRGRRAAAARRGRERQGQGQGARGEPRRRGRGAGPRTQGGGGGEAGAARPGRGDQPQAAPRRRRAGTRGRARAGVRGGGGVRRRAPPAPQRLWGPAASARPARPYEPGPPPPRGFRARGRRASSSARGAASLAGSSAKKHVRLVGPPLFDRARRYALASRPWGHWQAPQNDPPVPRRRRKRSGIC
jgi:hypothetical protein